MNFLVISWWVLFGIVPQQKEAIGTGIVDLKSSPATVAEVGFNIIADKHFLVEFSIENYQYKSIDGLFFNPYRVDYRFKTGVIFNDHISIFFDHECDHPIVSCNIPNSNPDFLSQESRIYVKFEGISK
jgi:hypothetical protein